MISLDSVNGVGREQSIYPVFLHLEGRAGGGFGDPGSFHNPPQGETSVCRVTVTTSTLLDLLTKPSTR